MTTETPAPQIPQALHMAMGEWGRRAAHLQQIDAEAGRLDRQITDMQRQLNELGQRYTELGRHRHDAEREESIARAMVEHGFQLAGLPMPEQPPAPPAPQGLAALGQPAVDAGETVTDPPDGGGQPEQPQGDFQPAEDGPRRRRGGRGRGE